ncbi:MAG TPA: caspase family protein [Alphaproteobacteria bacterium]|nr:caspase family protein [Alphaproteobacteria bacterium]
MRSWHFAVVFGAVLLAAFLAAGRAAGEASERRVALVIGNSQYVNIPRLANTANDARLIAETLERLGFSLVGGKALVDLDRAGIQKAIRSFGDQLNAAAVGLFYYAGHGLQIEGVNYLVPVDANPAKQSDVDFELVEADLVLKVMEGANSKLNLVILDACRNNPFGGRGLRDVGGGLAQMKAPRGTLISYATQPGNVASDGGPGSRDSPYALALAETLKIPGLELLETFNKVGVVVDRQTSGVQRPWVASSPIEGSFYFVPPAAPAAAPAAAAPPPAGAEREIVFWQSIKDSKNPADFEAYLAQYPKGEFRGLAQNRLSELKTEQQAALAPRAPAPVASAAPPESRPAPAEPTFGRFDGEWRGSVSAFGNNFSNNPCQNLEVTLKVVGNSVSGQIVGAFGRSAVSGTIAADGTVKGTTGADELSGRFQEDRFEGSLQGGGCRIGSISLKRSKS